MSEKEIRKCTDCKELSKPPYKKTCLACRDFDLWESEKTIHGVADSEIVSNEQGGRQSRLEYRFDLVDPRAMFALAKVMHEGAQKYEVDNWRKISVDEHLNHALSHIFAHLAEDKQDFHLSHALARVKMALAVELQNTGKGERKNGA